jgi:hypothetical protein
MRTQKNSKIVAVTCKEEENSQAFAGQHAKTSTSRYLFDEAGIVPDGIWKVAYGGLTRWRANVLRLGAAGAEHRPLLRGLFGRERDLWNHRRVDSRNSRFTNKTLIEEWRRDYGEDSDWFRVRVLGMPPRASELQYIDQDRVNGAQKRPPQILQDDPLIYGVDVSGGGSAGTSWWRS